METTGGTDVDWMVERNGGFILLEIKGINQNNISIKWGQLLAFRRLYTKLSSDGKCHFLVIGHEDIDYKNPESVLWYFDIQDFVDNVVPFVYDKRYKRLVVHKSAMKAMTVREFRELMEKYWKEFNKKKIDLKPKSQHSTSMIPKKEKVYSVKEIRRTYPKAYEKWTESDDEFLKKFWKENKQGRNEKLQELMQKFGRNRGAIKSRLNKMSFDLDEK